MIEFIKGKTVTVLIRDKVYNEIANFTFDDVIKVEIENDSMYDGDYLYHLHTATNNHYKVYGYTLLVH